MELEMEKALKFMKEHPEGRPFLPDSKTMRAITIGKSSIYVIYSFDNTSLTTYLTKIRDYKQKTSKT